MTINIVVWLSASCVHAASFNGVLIIFVNSGKGWPYEWVHEWVRDTDSKHETVFVMQVIDESMNGGSTS